MSNLWMYFKEILFGKSEAPQPKVLTVDVMKIKASIPKQRARPYTRILNGHKIIVLPFEETTELNQFVEENKKMVYDYVLRKLVKAVKNGTKDLPLFQLGNTDKFAQVSKNSFPEHLERMQNFFVKTEDYESAQVCQDLIKKLTITM